MTGWVHDGQKQRSVRRSSEDRAVSPCYEDPELRTRTSWVDARVAQTLVQRGDAAGNACALILRSYIQSNLYNLGCFQQRHCKKILLLGIILLSLCVIPLKTAIIETDVEKLWVEEGGRLQRELEYSSEMMGEGFGSSSQIVVQTPHQSPKNLLTAQSLLLHLDVVRKATQVEVQLFDRTWRFSDLCYKASFPSFENAIVERMLENVLPCIIITPLDCFWEGSKLLGPRNPIYLGNGMEDITWQNLNPQQLMIQLSNIYDINFDSTKDVLRRAGITTGYQEKPCLDPSDHGCPELSPNYKSTKPLDAAPVLTGGCPSFAPSFMHWEEDMIIGGIKKNRSNTIVHGEALQTIVQLMGEQELFNYYDGDFTVDSIGWTQEKAAQILQVFQKKFTDVVKEFAVNESTIDEVSSFTQASLVDIMEQYSAVSYLRIGIGYALMLFYAVLTLMNCTNPISSQASVGVFGVLLVSLSAASGLGFCSLLQLTFNAATTQILPFLALGLGVDDMFLMAYTFAENNKKSFVKHDQQAGELLKRAGTTVLLTSLSNSSAFFLAAIVPIPALRVFCIEGGILLLFNLLSMVFIFPTLLSIDAWRRKENRVDFICCIEASSSNKVKDISEVPEFRQDTPPSYQKHNMITSAEGSTSSTVLAPPAYTDLEGNLPPSACNSTQNLTSMKRKLCGKKIKHDCCTISLSWLVSRFYIPLLEKTWVKVTACVLFTTLLSISAYGISKVEDGMDLQEIVPRDTNEFTFLESQMKYFGFYNMLIVTKGDFAYHTKEGQRLIKKLHNKISNADHIVKNNDGTPLESWLDLMIQWLRDLQVTFDQDYALGCFHATGWFHNASESGMLAYKLLLQTGDLDVPIDYTRPGRDRLVEDDGLVNSHGFYNYLTAWMYNDVLAYDISQAVIRPIPKEWYYVPWDADLIISRAPSIEFARMPFYLNNLGSTQDIIETIRSIRIICDAMTDEGLPNYPSGVIFTFWEQYLHLRFYLAICLLAVIAAVFITVSLMLMNPWAAGMVAIVLTMITTELFGFMGLIGIKLSAIPVVILVVSVGIGVEFTIHVLMGFLTAIGDRSTRIARALEHMFAPVSHGAVSTLLGITLLAGSQFDFIFKYFFLCLLALVLLGLANGLLLFPILLSIFGPNGEIQPEDKSALYVNIPIPEPSPPPSPIPRERLRCRHSRKPQPRVPSDGTLSTISEESSQISSQEVVVEPTVHVETTVTPQEIEQGATSRCNSTTVKTKATVTVEVHTSLPGSMCDEQNYKRKRRKDVRDCHCAEVNDFDETSI